MRQKQTNKMSKKREKYENGDRKKWRKKQNKKPKMAKVWRNEKKLFKRKIKKIPVEHGNSISTYICA